MRLLITTFVFSLVLLALASPASKNEFFKKTSFRIPFSNSNKPEGSITFSIPPKDVALAFFQLPFFLNTTDGNRVSRSPSRPVSVDQPENSSDDVTRRGSGLTLEECNSSEDCAGNRVCRESSIAGDPSRCIPEGGFQACSSSGECVQGEECAKIPNGPLVCGAEQFVEREDPCIAVHSLQHLARDELVFEKDRLSNVLCDENGSCATSGHMVVYHGKGMMMKSYCEVVGGCVRKIMAVNSPRYRRGFVVPSKSENLVFSALSARYATRTEEGFLSAAIRLGF